MPDSWCTVHQSHGVRVLAPQAATLSSNLRYRVVAVGDKYHWLDRKTNQALNYKNGDEAQFDSLDSAIAAFVDGKLTVEKNEVME